MLWGILKNRSKPASPVGWHCPGGQGGIAIHSNVRYSKLSQFWHKAHSRGSEQSLQGCLGGCAPSHQHLERLTTALLLLTADFGTKTKLFSVKSNAKETPFLPSILACSARGHVMLVMTLHKLDRTEVYCICWLGSCSAVSNHCFHHSCKE